MSARISRRTASRIARRFATTVVVASLALLPASPAGAASRIRPAWEGPAVAQRHQGRTFTQSLWSLLTSLWAKSGAKIDGNG